MYRTYPTLSVLLLATDFSAPARADEFEGLKFSFSEGGEKIEVACLADWKALAGRRDHELANHTARHLGSTSDEEMEAEIRLAAGIIRQVAPRQGRLLALNLGGGTTCRILSRP